MPASWSRSRGEGRGRGGPRWAAAVLVPLLAVGSGAAGDEEPAPPGAGPAARLSITAREDHDGLLGDLPSSGTVWSLLETLEPMAILDRIDGAGLHIATPGRFSMRGTSWTQNRFVLDGADLTDPMGGIPLFLPDVDALAGLEVTSALAPVELSSPGVTMTLAPREAPDRWRGTLQASALGAGLQAGGQAASPPPISRFGSLMDASAVAGGPLGERLRVLLSAHGARLRRFDRGDPAVVEAGLLSGSGSLEWRPGDRNRLRLLLAAQALDRPFAARARFPGAPVDERVDAAGGVLSWRHTRGDTTASVHAGFWKGVFEPEADGREPTQPVERLLDGTVSELVFPARSDRSVWSLGGDLRLGPSPLGGGTHAPRLGVSVRRAGTSDRPGPGVPIPETVDGLAARVWQPSWPGPDARRHVLELAAWAAERLRWGDRLLLDVGVRLERTTGSAEGARQAVTWMSLLPRLSGRLRLADTGHLTLFGGWAEYQHALLTGALAFGDPAGPYGPIYRWVDANADGLYSPDERGDLVAQEGPGAGDGTLSSVDPDLRPPRTRELVAGLEISPPGGFVVSLTGFDRRESDLIESVNVGVPLSGYTVRFLPDPGGDILGPADDQLLPVFDRRAESFGKDRYLLTNPAGHTSLHQAVELRVDKPVGPHLALQAGATVSRTEIQGGNRSFRVTENDQGVVGELYDDPNADTYAEGRGYFDRAFTIKLGAAWRPGGDWRLGAVARYQDGQPFARLVVVPDLGQGPEAIPATTRGQTLGRVVTTDHERGGTLSAEGYRFTYTLTVDVRLEKGFALAGRRLALVLEAYNLLNTGHEVEEDPVWGPSFRDPTVIQPPRVVRLGARLDF